MRFQAGILGVPVRRPAVVETTASGAAGLAWFAAGVWASADEFLAARESPRVFAPEMSDDERGALTAGWQRAVSAALHWTEWTPGPGVQPA